MWCRSRSRRRGTGGCGAEPSGFSSRRTHLSFAAGRHRSCAADLDGWTNHSNVSAFSPYNPGGGPTGRGDLQSGRNGTRTALEFPPAVRLIVLHVSGPQEATVEQAAQAWADAKIRRQRDAGRRESDYLRTGAVACSPGARTLSPTNPDQVPRLNAVQTIRASLAELESLCPSKSQVRRRHGSVDMW